jgi:hypothetical protein
VIAVVPGATVKQSATKRLLVLASAGGSAGAGQSTTLRLALNATGRKLLSKLHKLRVTLVVSQQISGTSQVIGSRTVVFKAPKRKR